MKGPLGLKMNEQETQEYMKKLLAGEAEQLDGAESICFQGWTEVVNNLKQATDSLAQARSEASRLEGLVLHLSGQRDALFRTLIATEEGRRNEENPNLELVPNDEVPGVEITQKGECND